MGRAPCCEKVGLKKGRWTSEEDGILIDYIRAHGEGSWRSLPQNAGLLRCGKSCRLRWLNYLRADVKRGNISSQEEDIIIRLHASLGNRWSLIAGHLPGRTDNEIKNYWNSRLSRKIQNFNSPRNEVMPTAFVNLSKFIAGTCRPRRGRTGAKDIKHGFTPPSTTIQHVESSNYRNGFDEMLGQLEEQSVLSWPSEESTNAIKVCCSHQGSFESEFTSLGDILGSGVSRRNEEIDKVDQGNVSVGCSNYYQKTPSHETDRDVTNMHRSNGVLLPEKHRGGLLCAANSSAVSEEWADWTWDCSFQDQRMLDEEEMLSWLRDGSNA